MWKGNWTPHSLPGAAAAAVLLASLPVSRRMDPMVGPSLALLAVTFGARAGGRGWGLAVAALSALLVWSLGPLIDPDRLIGLGAFLLASYLLTEFATASRRAEVSRQRAESWCLLLAGSAREGIWVVDAEGRTTYVSPRMAEMLGYTAGEVIGQGLLDLVTEPARVEAELDPKRRAPGQRGPVEVRLRRSDGSKLRTFVSTELIPDGIGGGLLAMVEDVSQLRQAEQGYDMARRALRAVQARHDRLVESNVIGVITAELAGVVTEANDAFLRMLGYSRDDLSRGLVRWDKMTPTEFHPLDQRAIDELWATGAFRPYEKEFLAKDGTRVAVLIGAAALDRYPRQWIGFVLDLSERRRAEAKVREAKEAVEAASRAKDRFLAVLSHELRTPLTPVLLAVSEMLKGETPLAPGVRTALEMIRRNVELEARLIDDLLDITRIGRGTLRLDPRVVDAHDVIRQAVDVCRGEINESRIALEVNLSAVEHHVEADPARLQQVVWNLLKNADKFTPACGVIAVRSYNQGHPGPGGRPRLIVEVTDNGVGIDADALTRIFEAFEQGETSLRHRVGLGLGLAIGRELAEAHGGRLTASSPGPGRGSTFALELPTAGRPVGEEEAPEVPSGFGLPGARGLRILLVEDNKDTLKYLTLVLGARGYVVSTAARLSDALDAAASQSLDLVISDIELPDGTGLELMRHLSGSGVPGIAMSGYGTEEDIGASLGAGFAEHLTKPVDVGRLDAAIRRTALSSDGNPSR
jgi:PAS domain S-box-containing protein